MPPPALSQSFRLWHFTVRQPGIKHLFSSNYASGAVPLSKVRNSRNFFYCAKSAPQLTAHSAHFPAGHHFSYGSLLGESCSVDVLTTNLILFFSGWTNEQFIGFTIIFYIFPFAAQSLSVSARLSALYSPSCSLLDALAHYTALSALLETTF